VGDEYYIDLGSAVFNPGGVADVYEAFGPSVVGTTSAVTFGPNSLEFTLPLSLLGGNNLFNYGLIVGMLDGPSDRAPNGTGPFQSIVPEPTSLLLLGAASLAGLALRRRRRAR